MRQQAFMWLCTGLLAASGISSLSFAADQCPDMWSAQSHLVKVSKIARFFRDGIDKVYIEYTRADFKSRIDDLAASRVFDMQSFLTNHLETVKINAWQAFEILNASGPIESPRSAVQFAAYLTTKVAANLEMIERYEHYSGNMYDGVSNLARRSVLVNPNTDIGAQYGSHFSPLLQNLRGELRKATQALQHIKRCVE